ncbi:exocyst subunit [Umbelopsis nana]
MSFQFRRGRQHDDYDDEYSSRNPSSRNVDSFSEVEVVLRDINRNWSFMLDKELDPVTLALSLMDDSSVGRGSDYQLFLRTMRNLDTALKSITNGNNSVTINSKEQYYQGFNSSIGTFGGVLNSINDSQAKVQQVKMNLIKAKQALQERRSEVLSLWLRSKQRKEMINILDKIEELRATPEKLATHISNKHFLAASTLLAQSVKSVTDPDMTHIGALDDLRRNLISQTTTLQEQMIEELHNHLYLKSSYCDTLWSAYIKDQQDLPISTVKLKSLQDSPSNDAQQEAKELFSGDSSNVIVENFDQYPEQNSYRYIETLMESLAILGKVQETLEAVRNRLPIEIYALVDKTIAQVEERHLHHADASTTKQHHRDSISNVVMYSLDKADNESQNEILKDFLWTLYSKLEAVLRGHRVLEDSARKIQKRQQNESTEGLPREDFEVYHFHEIWQPVQSEIRTILHDYLSDRQRTSPNKLYTPISKVNDGMKNHSRSKSRDRSKQLFKFVNEGEDPALHRAYNTIKSDVQSSLKRQIHNFTPANSKQQSTNHQSVVVDMFANTLIVKEHKLLIKPNAYNVSVLLKPTIDNNNIESFGNFLDDFAVNIFLPQIEDKVMQLIQDATVGADAFRDDENYQKLSRYPVVRCATALLVVIQSLCRTMYAMPFHTDEYIRMIEIVLLKFYEKCFERFHSIAAPDNQSNNNDRTDDYPLSLSATWAQEEGVIALLTQSPYFSGDKETDDAFLKNLNHRELTLELKLKQSKEIQIDDLLLEPKKLVALGRLYHSLKWFVRKIWDLRTPSKKLVQPTTINAVESQLKNIGNMDLNESPVAFASKRWSRIGTQTKSEPGLDGNIHLPLKDETASRFDALLVTYQQLAETCLFTLRLEARCRVMYYLDMATQEGNYFLEEESYEPDPYIMTLNANLVEIDDCVALSLPPTDESFVFDGLPDLIVHMMISNAAYIKRLNHNGVRKMVRNFLALQQNLLSVLSTAQCAPMERGREYYTLFGLGPERMIQEIQDKGPRFTFDEYRVMLGLICDENRNETEADDSKTSIEEEIMASNTPNSRHNYTEWLLKLLELMDDEN